MANFVATLPQPSVPMVDETGRITIAWWYYLQRLFVRTGGATGASFGSPEVIAVGTSPFSYKASSNGFLLATGGGISQMRFSADDINWFVAGNFYAPFPLTAGDILEITYVRAPQMTFLPG